MQLEFDITNPGYPNHVAVYVEATLRITDAIVSVLSLEARITNFFFARLDPFEESSECEVNPQNPENAEVIRDI